MTVLASSLIPLSTGALCLSVGLYALWTDPRLRASRALALAMTLMALGCMIESALQMTLDEGVGSALSKVDALLSVTVLGSLLYLSYLIPYERKDSWPVRHPGSYAAVVLLCAALPAALVGRTPLDGYERWTDIAMWAPLWVAVLAVMGGLAVHGLFRQFGSGQDRDVRWRCVVIGTGLSLTPAAMFMEGMAVAGGLHAPYLPSVGMLLAGIVLLFAVHRWRLLTIGPGRENERPMATEGTVPSERSRHGRCSLVEGRRPDPAYRLFLSEATKGGEGLAITRAYPEQVRERYGLDQTHVIWLTKQPGSGHLDPSELSVVQRTTIDFLQKGRDAVVLLDGLEYLLTNNPTDKVLRMLHAVRDAAAIAGSQLIVPLDPDVMVSQELAFFEREFDVIRERGGERPQP